MSFTVLDLSNAPPTGSSTEYQPFQLSPLYRIASDGKTWVWIIGFDGQEIYTHWERLDNVQKGMYQTSRKRVDINSTGRNLYEQALLEAQSEYKRKKDKENYNEQIIAIDLFDQQAMLATVWDPNKNQIKANEYPIGVQPKLDGVRCRGHFIPGQGIILMSRSKKVINFLNQIREDLLYFISAVTDVLKQYFPQMAPLVRTDGELFSPDPSISFDRLNGITRLSLAPDSEEGKLLYYIFDVTSSQDIEFQTRYQILTLSYQHYLNNRPPRPDGRQYLYAVPTELANSKQDILSAHDRYVQAGYEGVIIRRLTGPRSYYKPGRSTNMFKYKTFRDEEGLIVGAYTGKGKEERAIIWQVQRPTGEILNVHPKGEIPEREMIWIQFNQNPYSYIGKLYRYKFQNSTENNLVRFPIGLGFVTDR